MIAAKHILGMTSLVIDWDYQKCLAEFNGAKAGVTRWSSGFTLSNEMTFGFSSPNQYQNCMINLPDNKLGTWIVKTMNGNDRTLEWTILNPMSNTATGTGLVVSRDTSYNTWSWLWSDGLVYTVSAQDKKLYRFKPNGTGYEYVGLIKTPNNATAGVQLLGGWSPLGRKYFAWTGQSSSTDYFSYLDMGDFSTWQGSVSDLTYLGTGNLMLPNGNIIIADHWGRYRVYAVSSSNVFSQVLAGQIGNYYSVGFCCSCPFAGMENWIYRGFTGHGTTVVGLNYTSGETKSNSHFPNNYENNWTEQGQLLPNGECFTWLQTCGTPGPAGNAGILYDVSADSMQYCVPSDGIAVYGSGIQWQSRLLQNGKIFLYKNTDNLFRGKLLDIGLNASFSYSLLTHPWFGAGSR